MNRKHALCSQPSCDREATHFDEETRRGFCAECAQKIEHAHTRSERFDEWCLAYAMRERGAQ